MNKERSKNTSRSAGLAWPLGIDVVEKKRVELARILGPEFTSVTEEEFCKTRELSRADLEKVLRRDWIQHNLSRVMDLGHVPGRHPMLLIPSFRSSKTGLRLFTPLLRLSLLDQPYTTSAEKQMVARNDFLKVVAEIAPRVLRDLADNVWPLISDDAMRRELYLWAQRHSLVLAHKDEGGVTLAPPEWILRRAEKTLQHWTQYPHFTEKSELNWGTFSPESAIWSEEFVSMKLPLHRPLPDPRAAEGMIRTVINHHAREHGLEPTVALRQSKHFVWAARFQVLGEYASVIAESVRGGSVEQSTIDQGISKVLRLVGLTKRKENPRPRKSVHKLKKTNLTP